MSAALATFVLLANHGKPPSRSFVAVLGALSDLDSGGYITQVARRAEVERITTARVLRRMAALGVADEWIGERGELGGAPRVYYALTAEGRELAEQITPKVA